MISATSLTAVTVMNFLNGDNLFMKLTFNCSFLLLSFLFLLKEGNTPVMQTSQMDMAACNICMCFPGSYYPVIHRSYYTNLILHFLCSASLKYVTQRETSLQCKTNTTHAEPGNPSIAALMLTRHCPPPESSCKAWTSPFDKLTVV